MTHRFDQVLGAAVSLLAASAEVGGAGVGVFRTQSRAIADDLRGTAPAGSVEIPAVLVYLEDDAPLSDEGFTDLVHIDSALSFRTEIIVPLAGALTLDEYLLEIRRRIHRVLMADITLGLSFVHKLFSAGADEPVIETDAEVPTASYSVAWVVHLRTNLADPGDGALTPLP